MRKRRLFFAFFTSVVFCVCCAPRCRFFARSREMISCVYKFFSAGSHLADETTLETLLWARFLLPPHIIRLTIKFFSCLSTLYFLRLLLFCLVWDKMETTNDCFVPCSCFYVLCELCVLRWNVVALAGLIRQSGDDKFFAFYKIRSEKKIHTISFCCSPLNFLPPNNFWWW